jgi:hypothetical protein
VHGGGIGFPVHVEGNGVPRHGAVSHQGGVSVTGHAVPVGSPDVVKHTTLFVRGVTIHAGRDLVGLLLPKAPLDGLDVDRLDAGVALSTGGRHVFVVDAGTGIGMREDVVGRVAGGADRGNGQTRPVEPVSMNGHGVVGQYPVLMDLVGS